MYIKTLLIFVLSFSAYGQSVVTTLPEFAWVVKNLAPNLKVISLLEGTEDPHFVDASPGFVFKVAKADLVVFNGLQLEIGWLPKILELSGNEKVQMGSKGYCDASKDVQKIEVLNNFNRSMGDVHPVGNPHYSLSLPRMIEAAQSIRDCLVLMDIDEVKLNENYKKLAEKLNAKFVELKTKIKPQNFYVYHREFNYLKKDFNLDFLKSLEKVPGVLPSATYLSKLAIESKKDKPSQVLAGYTSPRKILEKFKELAHIDYVKIPLHPKPDEDYLDFIEKVMLQITKNP